MKIIFVLLIGLLIFTSFLMLNKQQVYYPSKGEMLVNEILVKAAKIIQNKHKLIPSGSGASMPGGPIRKLNLCFDTKYPHSKEQLRELLIKIAKQVVNEVNENEEIQNFLKERPFTIKNVQIIIYNHDRDDRSLVDPDVSNAQIAQSILSYSSIDPENSFKYKNVFEESYEEALELISSSN